MLEKKSRDEKYIEKLQVDIDGLNKKIKHLQQQNVQKSSDINDLNNDIENMKIAEEFLENIAGKAIEKISQSDEKVKEILRNYDILLHHMDRMNRENENLLTLNENLTQSNDEFTKINEERILEMEKVLKVKNTELIITKHKLMETNKLLKNVDYELGRKNVENRGLLLKVDKAEEHFKIFEVQHEEKLKMMKNSYEGEIFFLYSQLSKTQIQLVSLTKNQKKLQTTDLDFVNRKAKLETEKKNYEITIKNYQNIIEVLSLRLKKSDTDVEQIMAENLQLKSEIKNLKTNYEKLRVSAEDLKKRVDNKDQHFEQLMISSETDMIAVVSKLNDYVNEKFSEIAELRKGFHIRDENLKKMSSTLLEEYTIGIELARIEIDDKQKKIVELENENKTIMLENLQLKMRVTEENKKTTLTTIEEETSTDEEEKSVKQREEENKQLKLKVNEEKQLKQVYVKQDILFLLS